MGVQNMFKYFIVLIGLTMCSCSSMAPALDAIAKDQNTASIHQTLTMPYGTVTTDIVRSGVPGSSASANAQGAAINVPTK